MRRPGYHIMLAIMALWMACVDKVSFDTAPPKVLPLIVDGNMTFGDTARVVLSKAYPADGKYHATPITGAQLWITSPEDPSLSMELVYRDNQDNGTLYKASVVSEPVVGHQYQLHVKLAGGQEFVSVPQRVTNAGSVDSIYFELVSGFDRERNVAQNGFNVYVNSDLPSGEDWNLRWKVNGVYKIRTEVNFEACPNCQSICYVTDHEDKFLLARSTFFKGNELRRTFVKYIPINNQTFYDRYHIEVVQHSVSSDAWEFYSQLRNQVDNASSLFQPAISSPKGNVYSLGGPTTVIGVFTASVTARKSIFIQSSDIPFKVHGVVQVGDCRSLPNATSVPPPFWN